MEPINPDPIGSASNSPSGASLENRHEPSHKSRKRPLQAASGTPAAKFSRHQVFKCETLSFEETFVHNVLKQSGFIHDKDDSELIRSASTLTLATSQYFETPILESVAHCTQVCQTIAKHLTARDILSLSQVNRFTYQSGSHRNRLLTSMLIERYYSQPPAIQEKSGSFTDQTLSNSHEQEISFPSPRGDEKDISMIKTTAPKLAEWLENHFAPQDKSWVESAPSRSAALARYLYKRSITAECCATLSSPADVSSVIRHPNGTIIYDQCCELIVLDLNHAGGVMYSATLSGHNLGISCITTLPNGWVVSGSYDRTLKVWDLNRPGGRECIATLGEQSGRISCATTHPRGWIISNSYDENLIRVWDLGQPSGMECIITLSGHSRWVRCLTTHPKGWVISGSDDKTIKIWDLDRPREAECIATLLGHTGTVRCLVTHPKGWVMSGSDDETTKIWDLNQPGGMECIATLTGHSHWVSCITSLSDLIISASFDETLKVWDLNQPEGMECIATLTGHSSFVESVTTASTDRVISGSFDKSLKVWNVSIDTSKGLMK